MTSGIWRIRSDGAGGEGLAVNLPTLLAGVEEGVWTESDLVRGPSERQWRPVGEHPRLADALPRRPLFVAREVDEAETDMTPMIDVTFQLVIFFMLAASFTLQKTLDVPVAEEDPPPSQRRSLSELEENNVVVRISADGAFAVDGEPVEPDLLMEAISRAIETKANADLVLDVDGQAAHETVVQAIDAAGGAGIETVMYVSRVEDKAEDERGGVERPTP